MAGITDKESPFTPGRPVPFEYFKARGQEIERLQRAIRHTRSGRNENVFITGERGIGKSSLAAFIRYLAEREQGFLGAHCFLRGVGDLEGMIRGIFQRLFQEISDRSLFDKLANAFGRYIKGITLFGFGVEFTTNRSELHTVLDSFLPALRKVYETVKDRNSGIILILDDLNGLTDLPEFAPFLKSFVDELATSRQPLPLLCILVGIPERRQELIQHQPSVSRIYDVISLAPMDQSEARDFFTTMFEKARVSVSDEASTLMADLSGGFPMLMHEVGDAVFWRDTDGHIDKEDARSGIIEAAGSVGRKYLDPQVYRALRSETYLSTLRRIGRLPLGTTFQRKKILSQIPDPERKAFDNFLRRITGLGMIAKTETSGEYRFTNQLYHLYVLLESVRAERQRKGPGKS